MICYAVIDTNVLVSALLSGKNDAATVQVLTKVIRGENIPVYSNIITKEYREVFSRKKFGFSIILPDMKDVPFYEVVLEKRDDDAFLVTRNIRHFPKEPYIVTPRYIKYLQLTKRI